MAVSPSRMPQLKLTSLRVAPIWLTPSIKAKARKLSLYLKQRRVKPVENKERNFCEVQRS